MSALKADMLNAPEEMAAKEIILQPTGRSRIGRTTRLRLWLVRMRVSVSTFRRLGVLVFSWELYQTTAWRRLTSEN